MRLAIISSLILVACVTAKPAPRRITECVTDPSNNALYCDGKTIPWSEAQDYVCHPLDEHEAYREYCQ